MANNDAPLVVGSTTEESKPVEAVAPVSEANATTGSPEVHAQPAEAIMAFHNIPEMAVPATEVHAAPTEAIKVGANNTVTTFMPVANVPPKPPVYLDTTEAGIDLHAAPLTRASAMAEDTFLKLYHARHTTSAN